MRIRDLQALRHIMQADLMLIIGLDVFHRLARHVIQPLIAHQPPQLQRTHERQRHPQLCLFGRHAEIDARRDLLRLHEFLMLFRIDLLAQHIGHMAIHRADFLWLPMLAV